MEPTFLEQIMSSELKTLRFVIAAADCGSFSSAALKLNTEVSAVSRAIRAIEDHLGVAIFDRLPRGVRLTDAGRSYIASAREIIERYERAGIAAKLAGSGQALHLSVGFVWSAASKPMVELLRALAAAFPTIAVEVTEIGNSELFFRARSGRLDVAIAVTGPPPLPRLVDIASLESMPLWLEPLMVAVPVGVALDSVTWADLADARLLCRTIDDWPRFVSHVERRDGPKLAFEPHAVSQEGVLGLVAAGLGWTILPASLDHLLPVGVCAIPIGSPDANLLVEAVWKPENENLALTRFLELCRQLHDPFDVALSRKLDPSP